MAAPAFRLFGFPVHVRLGFLMFIGLVLMINGLEIGAWFALFLTVLLLVHELGHALAARATGAKAEITLDFFAGYASFTPTRELRWWETAGISLAGPAAQFGVGVVALVAWGLDPTDVHHADWSAAQQALWFAGPVIALFNLIPVLPLDGGHVVQALLTPVFGRRAERITLIASLIITVAGFAFMTLGTDIRVGPIFVVLPLMVQLQMLSAHRRRGDQHRDQQALTDLAAAEASAWRSGDLTGFAAGTQPSPWYLASLHLANGHPDLARAVLETDLRDGSAGAWWPPPTDTDRRVGADVAALIDLLPAPPPAGHQRSELVLASLLSQIGRHEQAAHYGAACYAAHRQPAMALLVARAAATLGDRPTAVAWLRTALDGEQASAIRAAALATPQLAVLIRDTDGLDSARR